VQTCYDSGGRVEKVQKGVGPSAPKYVSVVYTAHDAISQLTPGNNLVEQWTYNPDRLQPTLVTATFNGTTYLSLGHDYCYPSGAGCATNNGNLGKQTNRASEHRMELDPDLRLRRTEPLVERGGDGVGCVEARVRVR
jgi:hypothetical protein